RFRRRDCLRDARGAAILVSENERANDVGIVRQMDLLAVAHRLQHDLHYPACAWPLWDAASRLYLSVHTWLGLDEHGFYHRRIFHGRRIARHDLEPRTIVLPRKSSGRQSLGRVDAGMGKHFTATARKLSCAATDPQSPATLGHRKS